MSKKDGILDLTIKKYWFEKIKNGEKRTSIKTLQNGQTDLKMIMLQNIIQCVLDKVKW